MLSDRRPLGAAPLILLAVVVILTLTAIVVSVGPATVAAEPPPAAETVDAGPRLLVELTPRTQQFLPGGTAAFAVVVSNVGSVSFSRVAVEADNAPDCIRSALGTLGIGQQRSYTCSRATVIDSFLLTLTATGQTNNSGPAIGRAQAFVNVLKPELRLIKRLTSQVVQPGDTARFTIVIFNTSSAVSLTDVQVTDDAVPDCAFQPATPLTLLPGESYDYSCLLADVRAPVIGMATVTARDVADDTIYTASDVAWVEVIRMSASLKPAVNRIPEPGADVSFTVELENTGSVYLDLLSLTATPFGDLLDPENPLVDVASNNCLPSPTLPQIPPGGIYTCTFRGTVSGQPSTIPIQMEVEAQDSESHTTSAAAATSITITNVPSAISVNVSADPSIVQSPGRIVDYEILIQNESPADAVTITSLTDSILGNLDGRGTCDVPTAKIPAGSAYVCTFSTAVNGQSGTSVSRTISAAGFDDDPTPAQVNASDVIVVPITDQPVTQAFLPNVTDDVVEPNNRCSQAYPIGVNKPYLFAVEDSADLYRFRLPSEGRVQIEFTNFVLLDSQLLVYKGRCNAEAEIARDPGNALDKIVDLGVQPADDYWIYIVNPVPTQSYPPYGLIVTFD